MHISSVQPATTSRNFEKKCLKLESTLLIGLKAILCRCFRVLNLLDSCFESFCNRDAAWELEPNAFRDLIEMYNHCDAEVCLNPDGRDMFIDEANRCSLGLVYTSTTSVRNYLSIFCCVVSVATGRSCVARVVARKRFTGSVTSMSTPSSAPNVSALKTS